ncbi:hypothetical protein PanWU01x14_354640, partial [Parasponia andersonii]
MGRPGFGPSKSPAGQPARARLYFILIGPSRPGPARSPPKARDGRAGPGRPAHFATS